MDVTSISTLIRYKAWANDLLYRCLSALDRASLDAPHPILFGSLIRTLNHVYSMDRVWQCHLLGTAHGLTSRNPSHCPSFEELSQRQNQIDRWFVDYAETLDAHQLAQTIEFSYIGGKPGSLSRLDILLHVVNHTTYHRGHVAAMLYERGIAPPSTDYSVFLSSEAAQLSPFAPSLTRSTPADD